MSYKRTIPRDLFNEAKLLKCLGRLSLAILDKDPSLGNRISDNLENEAAGFLIDQNNNDGSIHCTNYTVMDTSGTPIYLSSGLNSKMNFPLLFEYRETVEYVFDDDGNFSQEFIAALGGGQNG